VHAACKGEEIKTAAALIQQKEFAQKEVAVVQQKWKKLQPGAITLA
jgi:hypothetical protein